VVAKGERAEREAEARAAEVARLEATLAELREVVAKGERAEREAEARADEVVRLEAALAELREVVAKGERAEEEAVARAANIARLESELAGLRETAMRAQRDAEQSAAAAKSLRSELAAAERALVAAREVGRAAINALTIANPVPLGHLPQLGWRQAMRRWFGFAGHA